MPIYTFKCNKCEKEKTLRLNPFETPPTKCSDLDKDSPCTGEVHKILKPSSFSLKGSGWFKDGY
jgi:putative FmdB family regulatory protein